MTARDSNEGAISVLSGGGISLNMYWKAIQCIDGGGLFLWSLFRPWKYLEFKKKKKNCVGPMFYGGKRWRKQKGVTGEMLITVQRKMNKNSIFD